MSFGLRQNGKAAPAQGEPSKFKNQKEVRDAMLAKLKTSDLGEKHARAMRLVACTAAFCATLPLPVARAGFQIPYFDLNGRQTKFYRYRYLEYGHDKGFAKLVAGKLKRLRYAQPPQTVPELYLPPLLDWRMEAQDASRPLVITEGELKAACATAQGVPTLGLGGVWSFRSAAAHAPLLPMFESFQWQGRVVTICYDSDAISNWQVARAENALCRELLRLGAAPRILRLPALQEGAKTGLDDYIVAKGIDDFLALLEKAEPYKEAQELFQLNEEVLYIEDPGMILRVDTLQKMHPKAFTDHAYANRVYWEEKVSAKSTMMIEKSAPREWLKWAQRASVQRITYQPGMERVTPLGHLNMWRGWGCEPEKGDVGPWRELLQMLFAQSKKEHQEWFEQWLAYPLQYPGTKLYTACVLWGGWHGTGKSLVGYTMLKIYGGNGTEIGDRDLHASFNEWAQEKQFVMGDEITGGDKRGAADRMKSMITQRELRLNPKYVPSYTVPDCINYYFTSNHPDAFFLEDADRRFFIHEVKSRPADTKFYDRYIHWRDHENGDRHLFWHLLELNLGDFHPQGHAPRTASKDDMVEIGRSDLASWVCALREDPDYVLKQGDMPLNFRLFTSEELRCLYDPECRTRVTAGGISRELRRFGFARVAGGLGVRTQRNGQQRLWAVRDVGEMMRSSPQKLAAIYDEERKIKKGGDGKKF